MKGDAFGVHESLRKNSHLHYWVPNDVMFIKGNPLTKTLKFLDQSNHLRMNRRKKRDYAKYSGGSKPSIQVPGPNKDHDTLMIEGEQMAAFPKKNPSPAQAEFFISTASNYLRQIAAQDVSDDLDIGELESRYRQFLEHEIVGSEVDTLQYSADSSQKLIISNNLAASLKPNNQGSTKETIYMKTSEVLGNEKISTPADLIKENREYEEDCDDDEDEDSYDVDNIPDLKAPVAGNFRHRPQTAKAPVVKPRGFSAIN